MSSLADIEYFSNAVLKVKKPCELPISDSIATPKRVVMEVEVPDGWAQPDSPINKDPLPVDSVYIPSINCATIDLVKNSKLSKAMKKRLLELPIEITDCDEGIADVIVHLENKRTLRKALELVFNMD